MIKPNTDQRFYKLNDTKLRSKIARITAPMKNKNSNDIADEILELYCDDDSTILNVNIDWDDPYECYLAVIWDGLNIQYVKNQKFELCYAAIETDPFALRYIKRQLESMCIAAVEKNGLVLQHVKKQTSAICRCAVANDGMALQYVKDQTMDLCEIAIRNNPLSFRFVTDKTKELTMLAISLDSYNLRYANFLTPRMIKELIDEEPFIIFEFNNPPPELCLYAIKKDLRCIGSVHFAQVPPGPVLTQLQQFLVMAQLKFGSKLLHGTNNSLWYLPGMLHQYNIPQ